MAYTHPGLARVSAHANSDFPTEWAYTTADSQADLNDAGYFNDASADLNVGDVITVHHGSGAVIKYNVLSNAAGVVDVADGLALGTTDTD